jgi:integrase/recombinase XerD
MTHHSIEAFLEMIAAERGAARNTLEAYGRDLAAYADFLQQRNATVLTSSVQDIRAYLQRLHDEGFEASSSARRLSALRQLHRFCFAEGHRTDDPSVTLASPKRGRPLPKILSVAEVDHLLMCAQAAATHADASPRQRFMSLRMVALLEMLYATGLRVTELISLPANAVQASTQMMVIKGKGGKERLVPLTDKAKTAVSEWRDALQTSTKSTQSRAASPWLFPAESTSGHLPRQVFARDLKSLAISAGFTASRVSPHVLRHAFASHLLQNGADLRIIQQLLGHADIATTQIYTHILDERISAMVHALHPLAKNQD